MEAHQDSRMKKTWWATWWWFLPTSMTRKETATLNTLLLQRKLRKLQLTLTPTRQATTAAATAAKTYLTLRTGTEQAVNLLFQGDDKVP